MESEDDLSNEISSIEQLKKFELTGALKLLQEIQKVEKIYDSTAAKAFGIDDTGKIMVMIHTGSRGFGHQVCTDHLRVLEQAVKKYGIWLPDKQLACAPVHSKEGEDYLKGQSSFIPRLLFQ